MNIYQKINVLKQLIAIAKQYHPEFCEEETTGCDLLDGANNWLDQLYVQVNLIENGRSMI